VDEHDGPADTLVDREEVLAVAGFDRDGRGVEYRRGNEA
jgi:hypothetical protein